MNEGITSLSGVKEYSFERLMHTSRDGWEMNITPSTIVWQARKDEQYFVVKRLESRREWRKARRLIDKLPQHPGLALPLDAFRTVEGDFIVQEYAEGQALPRSLHGYHKLTAAHLFMYARHVADAIAELNKTHVHCDLRNPNIIIDGAQARIIDFGLAGKKGSHYTSFGLDGAWHCVPPQQRSWRIRRTPEIDQYSLQQLVRDVIEDTIYRKEEFARPLAPLRSLGALEYDDFLRALERSDDELSSIDEKLTLLSYRSP